jgi:hypothetical protein
MEIKQRIETCLYALEQKQQSVDSFQAKVKILIDSLKAEGMTPGTVAGLLAMLESVLKDYTEINQNCQQMIQGLREIGDHLHRIEDGRQKILTGVEAILQNLSHLDRLAQNGMQVGTTTGSGKSPKRILLVRISPDAPPSARKNEEDHEDEADEADEAPAGDTVVH